MTKRHDPVGIHLSRRGFVTTSLAGAYGLSAWLPRLAAETADHPRRIRSCIVLWMSGGPSQTDTFDLKPGHANGGPFREIATATPGIRISEHLPRVARQMNDLAVIRSMQTREGDHGRATAHLRSGYVPMPPIQFPTLGSLVAKETDRSDSDLPAYVSISLGGSSPGFLGPRYAPLTVGQASLNGDGNEGALRVQNVSLPYGTSRARHDERLALLQESESDFTNSRPGVATLSHRHAYDRAVRLMSPSAAQAFDLSREPTSLRDAYGRGAFGQSCMLARRLVERGVPFVEVALGGWDTHDNNFPAVQARCEILDPAWASLMSDLRQRGLLDETLVVWMGEFGRTPTINPRLGRDHYPAAWSAVLGGGGIRGGSLVGRSSVDGRTVEDRPVAVPDLLSTICLAIGVDPNKQNMSNVGRPIRIVDQIAAPLREILS